MTNETAILSFETVMALFTTAKTHLKHPKISLFSMNKTIVLTLAGEKSKFAGWISVSGDGKYPDREWFGRVSPDGVWFPSKTVDMLTQGWIKTTLMDLASDPVGTIQTYGKISGRCSFCGLKLTETNSEATGFGLTCAQDYGLEDQWMKYVQPLIGMCVLCETRVGSGLMQGMPVCLQCLKEMQ